VSVEFIDTNRHRWPVVVTCEVLELLERRYYAAKARALSEEGLKIDIRWVLEPNYQVNGAKR
jgi:hypothetical protein